MSEEFNGVPGVGPTADSQGQAGTAEPQSPIRLGIDLDTTVEGRAQKSKLQSQIAEANQRAEAERKAREAAEARAAQIAAQANAMYSRYAQEHPEAADELLKAAETANQLAELEQFRREKAEREQQLAAQEQALAAQRWYEQAAIDLGVDITDPQFRSALALTLTENNPVHVQRAQYAILNRAQQQQAQPPTPESEYVAPPGSGIAGTRRLSEAERDKKYGEYDMLLRNPTQNKAKIAALEKELE